MELASDVQGLRLYLATAVGDRYPARMTDERPTDAEVEAMIAELVEAGLLTVGTDAEGRETWALTPMGAQVATQMAMSSEEDAFAMFNALLDAAAPT